MKTENDKSGSGAVGKPGESTTSKADTLTSNGISGLLNSEFAKEDTADTTGQETPPEAEAETEVHAEEGAAENEHAEAEAEAGQGEQQADEGGLPTEMQAALDEWEAKGGALPEGLQRVVNKRIGRLTADKETAARRAEAAEEALKTLQAEAEKLRNDPNRPTQASPSGIPDEQELATAERAAKKFLDHAEAYLDDTATPEERSRMERFMEAEKLDATGLKRRVRQISGYLRDELPVQRQTVQSFRAQEKEASAQAHRDFPWLADPKAPEHQVRTQMLKLLPDLPKRLPNHDLVMGIYMLGYKQYQQQLAAAAGKGTKAPPPKPPAGNGATRTAAATKPKASELASSKFSKSPTRDNAVDLARAALMEG